MAQLMALIANVNRDPRRRTTPWTTDDFLRRHGPRSVADQDSLRPASTPPWRRLGASGTGEAWIVPGADGDCERGPTPATPSVTGDGAQRGDEPQPAAFLTSSAIRFSLDAVRRVRAKAVGHISVRSSSFASGWKPKVE